MSIELMSRVMATTIPTGPKLVLIVLADHADDYGGSCYPSVPLIADKCTQTDVSIRKHIQWLEKNGLILRAHARGEATHYRLVLSKIDELWVDLKAKHAEAYAKARRTKVADKDFPSAKLSTDGENAGVFTPQDSYPVNNSPRKDITPSTSLGVTANPYEAEVSENSYPVNNLPRKDITPSTSYAHPVRSLVYNHHITINKSTSSSEEVIHNPGNQPSNSAVGSDLENVVGLVSTWEEGRGKTVKISPSDRTKISYWLQVGVSSNTLKVAYDTAVAQRQKQGDPTAVTIGYLDSIIASLINSSNLSGAASSLTGRGMHASSQAPWYITDAGIENEANRIGCKPHPGEPFPQFKLRVLAYKQVPYEQYERDCKSFSNY